MDNYLLLSKFPFHCSDKNHRHHNMSLPPRSTEKKVCPQQITLLIAKSWTTFFCGSTAKNFKKNTKFMDQMVYLETGVETIWFSLLPSPTMRNKEAKDTTKEHNPQPTALKMTPHLISCSSHRPDTQNLNACRISTHKPITALNKICK